MRRLRIAMLSLCFLSLLQPSATALTGSTAHAPQVRAMQQHTSLLFIENVGQFAAGARFQAQGGGATLFLADNAIWFTMLRRQPVAVDRSPGRADARRAAAADRQPQQGISLKLTFAAANPHPRIEPFDRQATRVSYFIGRDRSSWHPDVPVWGGVRYADLYPGIDLELAGAGAQLAPRLIVRPGADLRAVRLRVEGADRLIVTADSMRLATAIGEVTLPLLQAVTVDGRALVGIQPAMAHGNQVFAPFAQAARPEMALVPQAASHLAYGTYLGGDDGSDGEYGYAIAVDATGAAYITGYTYSGNFPTTPGAYRRTHALTYVTKLSADGTNLVYSTFLGDSPEGDAIAVDATGAVYITGHTESSDFPTTGGAYDRTLNGGQDAYVVKLRPDGSNLVYATLLGGGSDDYPKGIAVDATGTAYITGSTTSANFPTTIGAYDRSYDTTPCGVPPNTFPCDDAFVVKLNPAGSNLAYATYLGGDQGDEANAVAVDGAGAAFVTGSTMSDNFPITPNAYDTTFGYPSDAFVVKLNPAGSNLAYATYLGGSKDDTGSGIAIDRNGRAYVTGGTGSPNFPTTPGAFDRSCGSDGACDANAQPYDQSDAFMAKLDTGGSALVYATFLGGSARDAGIGIDVDGGGSATVIAETYSTNFPTTLDAIARIPQGDRDIGIARLNPAGSALAYATYLGGNLDDRGSGIAVDGVGGAYVTGETASSDFPTTPGAYKPSCSTCIAGLIFVAKVTVGFSSSTTRTFLPVIAFAPPPPPDCGDVEDNDTLVGARPLAVTGRPCRGALQDDPVGEDDYYWVDLAAGKTIEISLTQIPLGADYDLVLYDAQGNQLRVSNNPGQVDEHLPPYTNSGGATARLYIRVYMAAKSSSVYNGYVLQAAIS